MPVIKFDLCDDGACNVAVEPPANSDEIKCEFERRAAALAEAIRQLDCMAILRLFKGKALYGSFVRLARARYGIDLPKDPEQKYNELRYMSDFRDLVRDHPCLSGLREKVIGRLSPI